VDTGQDPQPPTGADLSVVAALSALAEEPGTASAQALPLAEDVQLGLGSRLLTTVPVEDLGDPDAWWVEHPDGLFRGAIGPFSALHVLGNHVEDHAVNGDQHLDVTVGGHDRCAGPPDGPPPGLQNLRRVAVQPSPEVYESCLTWFSVDVYLDSSDRIRAITLDLWEP
jgi:hypothetical protein